MDLMSKNNKGIASLVVILLVTVAGYFFYKNFFPQIFNKITSQSPVMMVEDELTKSTRLLKEIQNSIGGNHKEWGNAVVTAGEIASDLVQICVDYPEGENGGPACDRLQYWTNNRTDKWQLLGSYDSGQEGLHACEDWESLKVAKGMKCQRWVDVETGWVDSEVDF